MLISENVPNVHETHLYKSRTDSSQSKKRIQHQRCAANFPEIVMMSATYENEQTELKAEVKKLQEDIQVQEQKIQNLEVFIKRVKKYTTLTELTPYALRERVKGIYVEAPDKSSGKRKQKAHIEYDLVGFIPVDELMKAEKV